MYYGALEQLTRDRCSALLREAGAERLASQSDSRRRRTRRRRAWIAGRELRTRLRTQAQ